MKKVILAAFLTLFATYSQAEDSDWYTGAGFGITDADMLEQSKADNDEIGFRLFAGNDRVLTILGVNFGAELGYANLGNFGTTEAEAIDLSAIVGVGLPLGLRIHARGGLSYWNTNGTDGTDPMYAAGLTTKLGPLDWRLEWSNYHDIDNIDVDSYMLSAVHRF